MYPNILRRASHPNISTARRSLTLEILRRNCGLRRVGDSDLRITKQKMVLFSYVAKVLANRS